MVMKLRENIITALFVAMAIVINIAEGAFPMPLPGIKLGLANVFTLAALLMLGTRAAFTVTVLRVFLVWLITGNIFAFSCSMTGGLLAAAVMVLLYSKLSDYFSVPWISVAGAWAFNAGQLAVAAFFVGDPRIAFYVIPLFAAGTAAGWCTGFLAELLCRRIKASGIIRD